jgi:hypothetical protein
MTTADSRPIHDGSRGIPKRKGPFCGGKLHNREGACTQAAGWGTTHPGFGHCKLHGGNAPSGRIAGAEQQARAELARLNVPPVENPLAELAKIAGQVVAWKDMLAEKVNALSSLRYETEVGGEQLRAEVALWERALDRCEKFLSAMARMNIEERMARVTEKQTAMVQEALFAALGEMGLTPEQQRDAQVRLGRHLRAVS